MRRLLVISIHAVGGFWLAVGSSTVMASEQPATRAASQETTVVEAAEACGSISAEASRLECFDSMSRALRKEKASSRAAAPNDLGVAQPDRAPRLLIVHKDAPEGKAARSSPFTAIITGVRIRFDKIVLALDNGDTWKQTSSSRPQLPRPGQRATFTKGLVGGWLASFDKRSEKHRFALVE